jgi:hypothetical protein
MITQAAAHPLHHSCVSRCPANRAAAHSPHAFRAVRQIGRRRIHPHAFHAVAAIRTAAHSLHAFHADQRSGRRRIRSPQSPGGGIRAMFHLRPLSVSESPSGWLGAACTWGAQAPHASREIVGFALLFHVYDLFTGPWCDRVASRASRSSLVGRVLSPRRAWSQCAKGFLISSRALRSRYSRTRARATPVVRTHGPRPFHEARSPTPGRRPAAW